MDDDQNELEQEKLDQINYPYTQRDHFLNAISQLESSGGQNVHHQAVASGPYAGQVAMGMYGMLPNTIQELTNRARLHGQMTPEMAAAGRDPSSLKDNTALQQQYAQQMADRILTRFPNDPQMQAYAWNSGHNLTPEQIKSRDYVNDPYVQKFSKVWKKLGYK